MSSGARVLAYVERHVLPDARADYLADVHARRLIATKVDAHFWVFEQVDEPGRFVEFTEAAAAMNVAAVHGGVLPAPLWREVQGG